MPSKILSCWAANAVLLWAKGVQQIDVLRLPNRRGEEFLAVQGAFLAALKAQEGAAPGR
jgi:hypothetical protein